MEEGIERTLDSCKTYTASSGMNKNDVPLFDSRPHDQRAIARGRGNKQARRLLEGPTIRHGKHIELLDTQLRSKGALPSTKDARTNGVGGFLQRARCGEDSACELCAGDPGECYAGNKSIRFLDSK